MELILLLCVVFFALQTTCSSLQIHVQSSHQQAYEAQQLSPPTLPRKLMRITEETSSKVNGAQEAIPNKQLSARDNTSGKWNKYQNEQVQKHGSGGTREEWAEGADSSQFFTMDYSHVRRRQPIHNKSLPVSP
ncbi:hypothetical protein SLEP1_g57036 [Rubroshorea leprosula]|uniref:Root meristem growth factor 8 n=1 Tax=Rubroshorea leprosula TaxID=152421 RepID=A0AAV5MK68_9ROSI|nr:hypothetical protein SLEP1_g57036 [Rubroshorea leprosula]